MLPQRDSCNHLAIALIGMQNTQSLMHPQPPRFKITDLNGYRLCFLNRPFILNSNIGYRKDISGEYFTTGYYVLLADFINLDLFANAFEFVAANGQEADIVGVKACKHLFGDNKL